MNEEKPYCLDDLKDIRSEFFYYHFRDKLKQTIPNDRSLERFDNNNNNNNNNNDDTTTLSVIDFYNNKNVLITGGSGFMGKVLVEKLLRSCTGIQTIYLLMREKKGVPQEDRLNQMLTNPGPRIWEALRAKDQKASLKAVPALSCLKKPAFDRLRKETPEMFNKIKIICGNCESLNLGISETDRSLLTDNVNIVFHVAASVRFDDPIKKAVLMNTRGTREVLRLAKEMINLDVLVQVSTSYANTYNKKVVDEIFYPSNVDWRLIIRMAENMDDSTLKILQPKILGNYPNTYTFTKALSEDIVSEESENIPIVVFRPSIVTGAYAEPIPGWIDNFNGPTSMAVGGGLGILHAILCDQMIIADWIAVDIAINAMIISAWYQSLAFRKKNRKCLIINACTSNTKPVSYNSLVQNSMKLGQIYPFYRLIWQPFIIMTTNRCVYNMSVLLFHIIPGFIFDILLHLKGEKFSLMKIYRRAYFTNNAISYFMLNEWRFKNGQFMSLHTTINKEESEIFRTSISNEDVILILVEDLFGCKRFLLHEDLNPKMQEKARTKLHRLVILQRVMLSVIFLFVMTLLWAGRNRFQILM